MRTIDHYRAAISFTTLWALILSTHLSVTFGTTSASCGADDSAETPSESPGHATALAFGS